MDLIYMDNKIYNSKFVTKGIYNLEPVDFILDNSVNLH
jgi:hypothetical protein